MSAFPQTASARRWWLWLPLLALAAWLALFGNQPSDGQQALSLPVHSPKQAGFEVQPAGPTARTSSVTKAEPIEALINRAQLIATVPNVVDSPATAPRRDLFSPRNWNPPPPPPAPVAEPAPVAPPLPFTFLGKKFETDAWEVYLARGEQTFIVREGQTLEALYRVDKIAPPSLALTYLPLGQPQILMIGDSR